MAKYSIEDTTLTNIAEAIRTKGNTTDNLTPLQMPEAINAIQTGGGGEEETVDSLKRTPEEVYSRTRPASWPVLPEPTQNNEFYFLCKTHKKNYVIYPYCGQAMTMEWGYIDDNGVFVAVHSMSQSASLTYWTEASISGKWVSPQMDNYYVMRTTGADCSHEKAASNTASSSTMKYVLEVKARCSNPTFMSLKTTTSYYTNGMSGCQYITLYGPQDWTSPAHKFRDMTSLRCIIFKDDNPFAKYNATTTVKYMFSGCKMLECAYEEFLKNWPNITESTYAWGYCYQLPTLDIDLGDNNIDFGSIAYYAGPFQRLRIRAPKRTTGSIGFDSGVVRGAIIEELDLSSHTAPASVYYIGIYAKEIRNLKLAPVSMTSSNVALYVGSSYNQQLRKITMAPDATEDNVPTAWKLGIKYASYDEIKEFLNSLPVTSTSRAITICHYCFGVNGDCPPDLSELATSKGYTLAFATP